MIDWDYGPGVFALWIVVAAAGPAIFGAFFVDAYWEKHQAEDDGSEDAFN